MTDTVVQSAVLCLAASMLASPGFAADVTSERLLNPDKEPQNWLMNHRTYDGQRFSPLAPHQQRKRQGTQAMPCRLLAPTAENSSRQTPLAEDGHRHPESGDRPLLRSGRGGQPDVAAARRAPVDRAGSSTSWRVSTTSDTAQLEKESRALLDDLARRSIVQLDGAAPSQK